MVNKKNVNFLNEKKNRARFLKEKKMSSFFSDEEYNVEEENNVCLRYFIAFIILIIVLSFMFVVISVAVFSLSIVGPTLNIEMSTNKTYYVPFVSSNIELTSWTCVTKCLDCNLKYHFPLCTCTTKKCSSQKAHDFCKELCIAGCNYEYECLSVGETVCYSKTP